MKGRFIKFLKDWMLVIGMISGASAYLIYAQIPSIHTAGPVLEAICRRTQPILLFLMLFISFSRIEPRQLKFKRWHIRNLALQVSVFLILCFTVIWAMHSDTSAASWILRNRVFFETGMLCMICPTATACAVVTGKLGGDMAQVVMYTIIINLAVSVVVPLTVPLLYPQAGITFITAFSRILAKVFPLLILPCLAAWTVRWLMPRFHDWVSSKMNLSFYLWSISLTIAILMSTRAIVHSGCSFIDDDWSEEYTRCDGVLDVEHIREYGRNLGPSIQLEEIEGGLHDLFLSHLSARDNAYRKMFEFLNSRL